MKKKINGITKVIFTIVFISNNCQERGFIESITSVAKTTLLPLRSQFTSSPHQRQPAVVEIGQISDDEARAVRERKQANHRALSHITNLDNLPIDKTLNIALCASGGGYRSMIATLALLQGLQENHLLDAIQYIATLSGSCWGVGYWISSNRSLDNFILHVQRSIDTNSKSLPTIKDPHEIINTSKNFVRKFVFDQPLSSVDLWGALIGNNLIGKQTLKLSEQQPQVNSGFLPYPIYTAIEALAPLTYSWYEFSPHDVRNLANNTYVKTWAFGRKYENKDNNFWSTSEPTLRGYAFPAELPLNSFMGLFGSAFTANIKEIVKDMESSGAGLTPLQTMILNLVGSEQQKKLPAPAQSAYHKVCEIRPLSAEMFTFTPRTKNQLMTLADAGIDFNLPIPPLLQRRRDIDLIIILDASNPLINAPALRASEHYSNTKSEREIKKLPPIDYNAIDKRPISIFTYENRPTIIYIPFRLVNECGNSYCSTFNFGYKKDEFYSIVNWIQSSVPFGQIRDIIANAQYQKYTT